MYPRLYITLNYSLRIPILGILLFCSKFRIFWVFILVLNTLLKYPKDYLGTKTPNLYFLEKIERSDFGLCPWDWSTRYCTNRRERPSLLDLLSEFGLISDRWLGSISPLEIGPMHLSVEGLRPWDWSYPVLHYLREWSTPTVVSSLSLHSHLCANVPLNLHSLTHSLTCHGYCRKAPTTNQPSIIFISILLGLMKFTVAD